MRLSAPTSGDWQRVGGGARVHAARAAMPLLGEVRLTRAARPLSATWRQMPVEPRRTTRLGVSFRSPDISALGLDARDALRTLLGYPFDVLRLGAYWNRLEPRPGAFLADELDWQIDAAERAGKQIMLCVGPLKTFGYPEFFVPAHHLARPLPEHTRIQPDTYSALLRAATEHIARVVDRYRERRSIIAWQLEHEAVDPLGVEHSWRLDRSFVEQELAALRFADPTRPVMMNGYLPTTALVQFVQSWRTRDQGDLLAFALRNADIVGIDCYPRQALLRMGRWTMYLDGSASAWWQRQGRQMLASAHASGRQVMVAEGQAEPWETVTSPPNPAGRAMYSCLPEHVVSNYNACMRWSEGEIALTAYLFWGAEYWLLRDRAADPSYLQAFARILEQA